MNLSVIIPNYNGEKLLKKNLPKVFGAIDNYKNGKKEIVVTDDCSLDNSINVIKELKSKIGALYPNIGFRLIENDKNLGFSSNVNKGAKNASGDILILLNTDVVPSRDFLSPLLSHFSNPETFAVGCLDESMENGKKILRGRGIGLWKKGFLIHSRGEVDRTSTLWVSGGSGAFRKSIWDKLEGFDNLYDPFYWEDIDLSYRALKCGYKILFEPKSVVIHEHEKGVIKNTYSNSKVKTIAYRNQFIFVWKNATDLSLQFAHLLWLPCHFLKALIRLDYPFFKGFISAFVSLPEIIQSSIEDQKLFTVSDKQIVSSFREEIR